MTLATAARKLKGTLLESQCLQTIKYISLIAAEEDVTLNDTIDGQDAVELMLSILDEMKSCLPSESALPAAPTDSAMAAVPPASALPAVPTKSALAAGPAGPAVPAEPAVHIVPAVSAQPITAVLTESALAAALSQDKLKSRKRKASSTPHY